MASFQSQLGDSYQTQQRSAGTRGADSPMAQATQQGAAQAMEFQLWVSQQATSLAKLKIFNTMAKSINDQQ